MKIPDNFTAESYMADLNHMLIEHVDKLLLAVDAMQSAILGFNEEYKTELRALTADDYAPALVLKMNLEKARRDLAPKIKRGRKSKKKDGGDNSPNA